MYIMNIFEASGQNKIKYGHLKMVLGQLVPLVEKSTCQTTCPH